MSEIAKKIVLNAGSGASNFGKLPSIFNLELWVEVRLDVDPGAKPDIVSSFVDMRGKVDDGRVDAIYCSHAIEHLYAHEVIPALREFRRVLKPDGFALVTCPDLAAIARQLLEHGAEAIAYQSAAGPIRAIDMLFGHSQSIADGRIAMAHNTGFTAQRLARVGLVSGFAEARLIEGGAFDLWALLLMPGASPAQIAPMFAGSELARLFAEPAWQERPPASAAAAAPARQTAY